MAEGALGVMSVACGKMCSRISCVARSSSSREPLVVTITGSQTTAPSKERRKEATSPMTSSVPSIPSLTARGARSSLSVAIVVRSILDDGYSTFRTSWLFWAVSAVITEQPCAPSAWKACRSACMPAPPPESDPAMVHTMGPAASVVGSTRSSNLRRRLDISPEKLNQERKVLIQDILTTIILVEEFPQLYKATRKEKQAAPSPHGWAGGGAGRSRSDGMQQ